MAENACNLVLADLTSIPRRLDEFIWKPLGPGVEVSSLHQDAEGHIKLALLRYAPGAKVPEHVHKGLEYIQILAGSQQDERGVYSAGTLLVSFPGTRHSVASPDGCVVLAVWEVPVQFV